MFIDKISLKSKAVIGSMLSSVIVVVVGLVLGLNVQKATMLVQDIEAHNENIILSEKLSTNFLLLNFSIRDVVLNKNNSSRSILEASTKNLDIIVRKLKNNGVNNPAQLAKLNEVEKAIEAWENQFGFSSTNFKPVYKLTSRNYRVADKNGRKFLNDGIKTLKSYTDAEEATLILLKNEHSSILKAGTGIIIAGVVIALILSLGTAIFLSSQVINMFKEIFSGLDKFSTEELRNLKKDFSALVANMNKSVERVGGSSSVVNRSSELISSNVSEQAKSIDRTSSSIEEISGMTKTNVEQSKKTSGYIKKNARSDV